MKKVFKITLCMMLAFVMSASPVFAASSAYTTTSDSGHSLKYVTIDMNDKNIEPVMMTAGSDLNSAESVASMAQRYKAFAAINGTYFSAYDGNPVSWGTIIKDGKILHISNGGAVAGITKDGKLIIDRLSFDFYGYINGVHRSIPWRINHPSPEADAITIFTEEYGIPVKMQAGAMAPIVDASGEVVEIATSDFTVPKGGFAIVYNPSVAHLAEERFDIGDDVYYEVKIKTTYTNPSDWEDVVQGVGAGPSLIINGMVTANGEEEGFFEDKINKNAAGRSFIGATADGKILIGNIGAATLTDAAAICQNLGLVNAMCLDGGGSIALYYNGAKTSGRNVNNALGFVDTSQATGIGRMQKIQVDGVSKDLYAYNINGNNYFKLRDIAAILDGTDAQFEVGYDNATKAVSMNVGRPYTEVGGEMASAPNETLTVKKTPSKIYVNGRLLDATVYNIHGNNYFMLREIGKAIDFGITWDNSTKMIGIDSDASYKE
ncbi:MAG: phosphodiester glycosidase family protein [Clostridiales bacterium]|nr:phosphodiester glycosidase family protein [Clostridiales bacterium]